MERWLELVLEHSSDAIVILDRERVIRYANRAAAALAEMAGPDELYGVSYDQVLEAHEIFDEAGRHPDRATLPSHIALTEGRPVRGMVARQVHRQSGRQRWISIASVPLFTDEDSRKAQFAILFFTDISDQKARQDRVAFLLEATRGSSVAGDLSERFLEKARVIVPLLADWCTVNVLQEDGRLARVAAVHRDPTKTAAVEQLATLAMEGGADRSVASVITTGEAKLYHLISPEMLAGTFPTSEGTELLRELAPRSAMILPVVSGGRTFGALSLAYTEESLRTYTEDDLDFMREFCLHLGVLADNARLYGEVEARDKAKDAFMAALSHELRNPLAPIKSALELLAIRDTSPEAREALEIVDYQFNHVQEILRDLLDVTRFTRGLVTIEERPLELAALLTRAADMNEEHLRKKGITLHRDFSEGPLAVVGDSTRLQQAVMNILQNAEKFTPAGGNVWIALKREGDRAVISIRDDGEGMEAETLAHVFDSYGPQHHPRQAGRTGLGLGLVLVRDIIRLHGGSVEARSPGKDRGSTFTLVLPLSGEALPCAQMPPQPARENSGARHRILIVDDNEAAARGLDRLLAKRGHETAVAHDGAGALAAARSFSPTVILLDIGLPDMSGLSVGEQIRAEHGRAVLLIALSGYGQQEDIEATKAAGFDCHLVKPASLADIESALAARLAASVPA